RLFKAAGAEELAYIGGGDVAVRKQNPPLPDQLFECDLSAARPRARGTGRDQKSVFTKNFHVDIVVYQWLQKPTQHEIDATLSKRAKLLLGGLRFDHIHADARTFARQAVDDIRHKAGGQDSGHAIRTSPTLGSVKYSMSRKPCRSSSKTTCPRLRI